MIDNIIAWSIKNKLMVALLTLALIGTGLWSITKVPIDAVPDITNNQVQVITQAPNLGTEDIEQFVTYPVEVAMANLPGVTEIRSVSRFGLSVVTIVFEDDFGNYLPRQLVAEKLTEVKEKIPQGFGEPMMGPISTGLGEIYQYTLEVAPEFEGKYSATELRTIQDWIIRRQMAMVKGVVEVNAFGGSVKQYEVAVNPEELKAIGITIADLMEALNLNNQNTGGAYIEKNHQANFIRGEGLARSVEDLENIVVTTANGLPITVKDVATVRFGQAIRYGALTKDGKGEAVGGMILMLKGANSDEVVDAVKLRVEDIQKSLPEGVSIEPFLDRSSLIAKTTGTVSTNLIEGALIVIFVLVFLLGNWRGGLIVASTIPLSLLFAFILMNVFDVWANLMSLGAIDFGIIIDGAVIIVESTVFFLHDKVLKKKEITEGVRNGVAKSSASKMMNSAFFGQLIILIVFIPILALEGVEGKMFQPMALTFMFAMIGVMILCLTYVPMMSAWFIRVPKNNKLSWGDKFVVKVENIYERSLGKALGKAKWIIGLAVVLLGISVFIFSRLGGEFIPQLDEGDLAFHAILKPGSSLSETIETTTKIEKIIKENFPEAVHVISRIGVADVPTDPMPMDIADCFIILKPTDEWISAESKEDLIDKIKEKIEQVPGVNYEFTQPIEMRFNELLTGVREDIAVKLFGEDLEVLAEKAEEMGKLIAPIQGVADMKVEATSGLPQMTVNYNRQKLAQYGLTISELNTTVQSAFAGGIAGVIFEGERRFDLVVRLDDSHRQGIDDLKNLYVNLPNGSQIPLNEVAKVSYEPGPMQISRDNTNRRTYVGINVRGRDVKSLVTEIQEKLDAELDLPAGYYIRYGGAFENLERATNRLKIVVPIALGLIFLLIFFALKSIKQTIMIYMAIPLAAIGGIISLWLRDMPFSISAGVGFIVLFGVAVLNGLVLISGWNELKEEGETNLNERIRIGAKRRIRPIMLTALTDILGFLPMAISTSAGAEVQQPLATVVIGGMISATLLTLFILPLLYRWVENRNNSSIATKPTAIIASLLFVFCFAQSNKLQAQESQTLLPISMEVAVNKVMKNYPTLKAMQLEVENQEALKKTTWDFGKTSVFTGGEELNGINEGVKNVVGIQQQNMDVFSIPAKSKLQKEKVLLAKSNLELSNLELSIQVKQDYGSLYSKMQLYNLYEELDSTFVEFERAAKIRYKTEATSHLAYLSASNQAKKISNEKNQAFRDYQIAIQQFNRWFLGDTLYTVEPTIEKAPLTISLNPSIENHPVLLMENQKVKVAEQSIKAAQSNYLPQLNLQYGVQEVSGESGFYQYQLGVNIPLFFNTDKGKVQSAKINSKIAEERKSQATIQLKSEYAQAQENYLKWKEAWNYYEKEALELAKEQRNGASIAYREGAIDYISFLQLVKDAIEIERDGWQTYQEYLNSQFKLEYFINVQ
ncbi:CusA/CzcA family heavy metal efflux RND transporter [Acidiluteibacter ferrifornacis]|uniref:CusA/CzcA family heavy metal efflux RND transporter n=1 Tax=Acidiluteibacter ferrifornacis TaxID=2692424 RepID=A0A6N9NIQ3_9FLAO|nr:CusA/CzcA family heavy metal efflux RND transporter [Acidiluteibacter ferrifornacis]NBG65722.1 CusA/CzcA family heavy metal efflux RND transporter [Acidiluteibacter ferrifornacis]